jgi:hypothetical protein
MNKLFDSINPVVIDDELLNQAIAESNSKKDPDKNGKYDLSELENLRLSFKGIL